MPTENTLLPFHREDRYIVIKRSDLKKVPVTYRSALVDPMLSLLSHLPRRECVVVEHDWPEYHLVWAMIEHRMGGKPVPDFNLWRRADALQALLTAADEQADDLSSAATKALEVLRSLLKVNACGMHYAAAQMACHQLSAALKSGNS